MSSSDYSSYKVVDLKKELKNRGLSTSGNKDELIERLNTYTQNLLGTGSDIDGFGESMTENDILDEDGVLEEDLDSDDEVLKKSAELVFSNSNDNGTLDLPGDVSVNSNNSSLNVTVIAAGEEKVLPQRESHRNQPKGEKKVHLIRNRSLSLLSDMDLKENEKEKGELNEEQDEKSDGVKIPTKVDLQSEERLELRKRKFGAVSDDDKKAARAARFGLADRDDKKSTPFSSDNLKNNKVVESVDVLKQRAQRFGISVAPALQQNKSIEALKTRAERFGIVVSPMLNKLSEEEKMKARKNRFLSGTTSTSDASLEEKKKLRAQRFGIPT